MDLKVSLREILICICHVLFIDIGTKFALGLLKQKIEIQRELSTVAGSKIKISFRNIL